MFKRCKRYLGFDDRYLILFGFPLALLISSSMVLTMECHNGKFLETFIISSCFTVVYWLSFREFIFTYHRINADNKIDSKRIIVTALLAILLYFLVKGVLSTLIHFIYPQVAKQSMTESINISIMSFLLVALVTALYEIGYYYNLFVSAEKRRILLEKTTVEQKLQTLKSQINPHFLFNSLNTLTSLINQDQSKATEFVQKLSSTYRNILDNRNEKLITIQKELDTLDSYNYLLKLRFQNKLKIEINIDSGRLQDFIMPLSLQILIENAVKHNVISKSAPLIVSIYDEGDYMVISNPLRIKNQKMNSTKVGLSNIKDRYALYIHEDVIVMDQDATFTVKLPIIKNFSA